MIKKLILILTFIPCIAFAQQQCVCVGGCKVASAPYPAGIAQPTSCAIYKNGVQIASGPVVASSSIPLSNASICLPADTPYSPGPTGSVSCLVAIPPQVACNVTLTGTASDAAGESAQSAPFTFVSVAALPTVPTPPTAWRVN